MGIINRRLGIQRQRLLDRGFVGTAPNCASAPSVLTGLPFSKGVALCKWGRAAFRSRADCVGRLVAASWELAER